MFGHVGTLLKGCLTPTDLLDVQVEVERRAATARNHSATHLIHAALRAILGTHVAQKGSLVDQARLRFDFSHHQPIAATELDAIEDLVNAQVRANLPVITDRMSIGAALESGAVALFGEKYGDEVRVLRMGDFSVELCGGTHVARTGDIGLIKIVAESGVASGVRRIEAVTGAVAVAFVRDTEDRLAQIVASVRGSRDTVVERVLSLSDRIKRLEKDLARLKAEVPASDRKELPVVAFSGVNVLAMRLEGADAKSLRAAVDQYKDKLGESIVVLGTVEANKVALVAGVAKSLTHRVRAGDLMAFVAEQVGGKGGGRPDMAQGGGPNVAALEGALAAVVDWVQTHLST